MQQAEFLFVAKVIGQLVNTSATNRKTSRNISFLADHFKEGDELNKEVICCSSSLFKWAEADIWKDGSNTAPAETTTAEHEGKKDLELLFEGYNHPAVDSSDEAAHRDIPERDEDTLRAQMLSAKMHCLYGVPVQEVRRSIAQSGGKRYSLRKDTAPIHPYVRSRIYDLRQHSLNDNGSFWGPLLSDGSQDVDWEKLEAIMVILHINMSHFVRTHDNLCEDAVPDWTVPFKGTSPYSYRSRPVDMPVTPRIPLEAQDPYNISGTWMRVVCFLDYTELYDFNFGRNSLILPHVPRPPLDTEEATRLITMRIQVTKIVPPGPDEGQALPVVHFKGASSSHRPSWDADANSEIRGKQLAYTNLPSPELYPVCTLPCCPKRTREMYTAKC